MHLAAVPVSGSHVRVHTYKHSLWPLCLSLDHTCVCTHTNTLTLDTAHLDHTCVYTYTNTLWALPISGSHMCVHIYKHCHSGHYAHLWITHVCTHTNTRTLRFSLAQTPILGSHAPTEPQGCAHPPRSHRRGLYAALHNSLSRLASPDP